MFCKFCGKPIEAAEPVCSACGKPQQDSMMPPPGLKRGQFYKKHFRCRAVLRTAGILCYTAALLNLLFGFFGGLGMWSLIDIAVLLFFGGLMHLVRSRFCAVVLCVYALVCIVSLFINGFAGWAVVTALITVLATALGVKGTFCFAQDWKQYCGLCGKAH